MHRVASPACLPCAHKHSTVALQTSCCPTIHGSYLSSHLRPNFTPTTPHPPPPHSFSNIRARIPFEDLPYPGPVVSLCQDIAIARASGLLAAEERLFWKLIGERGGEGGVNGGFERQLRGRARPTICRLLELYERTLQQMPMEMEPTWTLCDRLPLPHCRLVPSSGCHDGPDRPEPAAHAAIARWLRRPPNASVPPCTSVQTSRAAH